ncbi:hypothetical protein SAMN02746041_03080 [Desulfacinum hydrothermale DSM 13146]|uniref:J domain-containing protein n=1 Tax=Desulfacinum hydrothermale DSM 13146 TaxID=1121390 RepID=A0A1W1XVB7_9BACT|nr:DnaJ domain-containing protein [Desulfacinum hydrothermale]SMC27805.1 hypothetical protein SAMN02746041_03080 [Desulfacinum hydrothermale DSM 13146]
MTREEALANLNLKESATLEEIEAAYRRLLRRYPPEFHPERFREIDESYRVLTSVSYLIEKAFSSEGGSLAKPPALPPPPHASESDLEEALRELWLQHVRRAVWQD